MTEKRPEHPAVTEAKKRVVAVRRVSRAVEGLTYDDARDVFVSILDALSGDDDEREARQTKLPPSGPTG
jgi:hypothetical protein